MIYVLVTAVVAAADLLIKNYIERYYWLQRDRYIWGGFVRITKSHNEGGFLNLFEHGAEYFRRVTYALMAAVLVIMAVVLCKKKNKCSRLGAALMTGGALSNEYDRFAKGSVTDYFSLRIPKIKDIVFNLGDMAIFAGAVLLCIGEKEQITR